jgi:hypothetical protein
LTVGKTKSRLVDERFGDGPRYHLCEPKDIDMRVPDQVRKTVLFVGLPEMPEPEYRGTGFIVTVPGENKNHFAFMVTARHVAEKLAGKDFYIRVNKKDGTTAEMRGRPDNPWWYHPSEKEYVDAAVTLFAPARLSELDVEQVPIAMFADDTKIATHGIGIGDEVFITGLFTKVVETTRNIPVVRTGNVAMIPGEKIPFGDSYIDAYLIESRSIGGLSGSPVFVRPTITMTGQNDKGELMMLAGVGQFYLFGSMIGHWEIPKDFTTTQQEAVNMGIAPIVPAQKIKEILLQPKLVEFMKKIDKKIREENRPIAKLDFAESSKRPFTQDDFETALKKASRKTTPKN